MDDLRATCERDQYYAMCRENVTAIAGDVNAYFGALSDEMTPELRDFLTRDFAPRWHAHQLDESLDGINLMYAEMEGDEG